MHISNADGIITFVDEYTVKHYRLLLFFLLCMVICCVHVTDRELLIGYCLLCDSEVLNNFSQIWPIWDFNTSVLHAVLLCCTIV